MLMMIITMITTTMAIVKHKTDPLFQANSEHVTLCSISGCFIYTSICVTSSLTFRDITFAMAITYAL